MSINRHWITVVFCTICMLSALLSGCGSATGDGQPHDQFREDCLSGNGVYTENENRADSCTYGSVVVN